ncbi:hypothetical protein [Salinibacterium sp.]|uniref:hypothetical protein n=1 Tax=Salinibacterium sp. TaxID=1915057 RepID=UPI00286CDF9B|nr:hypothetical protein [Salinibacterium sp.]
MEQIVKIRVARRHIAAVVMLALVASGAGVFALPAAWGVTTTVPLNPRSAVAPPTVLMAAAGNLAGGAAVVNPSPPKHFWISGFDSPSQTVAWSVSSVTAASYHVDVLVDGPVGATFAVQVDGS